MNSKTIYRQLEIASIVLFMLIAVTIAVLITDWLSLFAFKIIVCILLVFGCLFFIFLRKTVKATINQAKLKFIMAEDKFGKLYDTNVIGILISNFEGRITDANAAFLNIIGYTKEDLSAGKLRWDVITPEEFHDKSHEALQQLSATGKCLPFEKQYIKKDGSRVWVLLGSAVLKNDDRGDAITYIIDINQKKLSEEQTVALQKIIIKQQKEFKSVLMNAPAFITIKRGKELRFDFVNKAVMDASGRTDQIGKTREELYPGLNSEDHEPETVYRTGVAIKGKRHRIKYRDNQGVDHDLYVDYLLTPVYDEEGKVDGVATFGFDVTDLVLANREMEISKSRFSSMADAISHIIWMATKEGELQYINKTWLGYAGDPNIEDWDWLSTVHEDDYIETKVKWNQSIKNDKEFSIEARLKDSKGNYKWHLIKGVPLKDNMNDVVMWIGSNIDIHDQKLQVKQLIDNENHFKTLADETPFMVWKSNEFGDCVYVNKEWIDFTGLSFEESMGKGFFKAMSPTGAEERRRDWTEAYNARAAYSSKFMLLRADGESRWVLGNSNPYYIEKQFKGFIGSIIDITEQELLSRAEKELSEKKDEFMSIASHELKTPLTSVKAFIQLIEKSIDEDHKAHLYATKAAKNLKRLEILIADLLDVSKINAGRMIYNESKFEFNGMLEESVSSIQNTFEKHEIILNKSEDVMVMADKFRIEQVVYNLLSNAIKYSPKADTIIVTSVVKNEEVIVSVQDFGIGIEKEDLMLVTNRYYRVDKTAIIFQGLGLGLYISSEIIGRHKGKLWIESEPGIGSTFYFSLPVVKPE